MIGRDGRAFRLSASAALLASLLATAFLSAGAEDVAPAREAVILTIDGPVTPANAQYVAREIGKASDAEKELIVIEIDTPGGLVDSMKTIIKAVLASETPVATYVSPQGARSASAGLYIMYAAHISAMAPNTNTGAATPVEIGGTPSDENPFEKEQPGDDNSISPSPSPEGALKKMRAMRRRDRRTTPTGRRRSAIRTRCAPRSSTIQSPIFVRSRKNTAATPTGPKRPFAKLPPQRAAKRLISASSISSPTILTIFLRKSTAGP